MRTASGQKEPAAVGQMQAKKPRKSARSTRRHRRGSDEEVTTGNTLCDPQYPLVLEAMHFPEPVVDVAIEPKSKVDEEKLSNALQRLSEEDPTFRVRTDDETSQTVISGMGELHLEILVDRMMRGVRVRPTSASSGCTRKTSRFGEVRHRFVRRRRRACSPP